MCEWIVVVSQADGGVTCFGSSSTDDEASKPLHSFDKNIFELCKVPADQIAVSEDLLGYIRVILWLLNDGWYRITCMQYL